MKKLKALLHWLIAFALGLFIVNGLCYGYERPAYFIKTGDGASPVIRHPGVVNVHGTEGYSIGKVDRNGYLNPDKVLSEDYVLVMGASHTLGKELPMNQRFSVLVSDALSQGDGKLHAYNIAHDGNFLPSIFNHFQNAVQLYPNSAAIVIEIGSTDFSPQEIMDSLKDIPPCNFQTAQERFANIGQAKKLKCVFKEALPLYELLQIKRRACQATQSPSAEFTCNAQEYLDAIDAGLENMRRHYSGPIVFVYHPQVQIKEDGSIRWLYSNTWSLFQAACARHHIDILDLVPGFDENYSDTYTLPYGFSNTTPGKGHMNAVGHRIAADEIIAYCKENLQ